MAKQKDPFHWRKIYLKPEGGVKTRLEYAEWRRVYREYMQSEEWAILRNRVKHRDFSMCQGQKENGKMCCSRIDLQVHHKNYDRFGKEDLSDLITLCADCHSKAHGGRRQNGDG